MDSPKPPISEQVVQAVAAQTDTDPTRLPPLYNTIEPEALDAFVAELDEGQVRIQYADTLVTVESTGDIHVDATPTASGSDGRRTRQPMAAEGRASPGTDRGEPGVSRECDR